MARYTSGQAREVAALYQSPGTDGKRLATFASSGTILPGLADDIRREITSEPHEAYKGQLRALLDYVESAEAFDTAYGAEADC